jgi:hypothetical protein
MEVAGSKLASWVPRVGPMLVRSEESRVVMVLENLVSRPTVLVDNLRLLVVRASTREDHPVVYWVLLFYLVPTCFDFQTD